ncbi:MAG: hypothetical protein M5U35_08045 [Roseovarius sp.]|nr:hypothetical protein [Roseovarius sp.]
MIALAEWVFWLSLAAAVYVVAGYGLCLVVLSRLLPRRPAPPPVGAAGHGFPDRGP